MVMISWVGYLSFLKIQIVPVLVTEAIVHAEAVIVLIDQAIVRAEVVRVIADLIPAVVPQVGQAVQEGEAEDIVFRCIYGRYNIKRSCRNDQCHLVKALEQ